jgi:hypothetical protein
MTKYPLPRKWLAIGIILLFVGTGIIPIMINAKTTNHYEANLNKKEYSPLRGNITVTFTYPENGIYWNDRKIMPYSVPLILHGNGDLVHRLFRFYRDTPVEYTITGPIFFIEFYLDGALVGNITSEPWEFVAPILITSFSHKNFKIIAYGTNQDDWGSDEITIYRLFL